MTPLHTPSTTLAPAHMNAKFDPLYPGLRYLRLILLLNPGLFQCAAAVRTTTRQFGVQRLVNRRGNRTATAAAIPCTRLPPRLRRMGLGPTPRERRRLTLSSPLRFFQGAQQLLHPALQFVYSKLQSLVGGPQLPVFFP